MSVQKKFGRDLCIPVVLMCLELFSKRTKVTIIQITNYNSIELVCILAKKEKIPKGLSFIHTSNLLSAKENYEFFHKKYFSYSWLQEESRVLFIKIWWHHSRTTCRHAFRRFQKGLWWSQLCLFRPQRLEHKSFVFPDLSGGATSWNVLQGFMGFYILQK